MPASSGSRLALTAFVGVGVLVVVTLAAGLAFTGTEGQPYSVLNHNISELGKPAVSELAWLFNAGVQLGGGLLALFGIGLVRYVQQAGLRLAALGGVVHASAIVLVGAFPIPQWRVHQVATALFYFSGLATVILCTVSLLLARRARIPRSLAAVSGIGATIYIVALVMPMILYRRPLHAFVAGPVGPDRPAIWLPSVLEWLVALSTLVWVLVIAVTLYRQARRKGRS